MNSVEPRSLTIGPSSGDHLRFAVVEVMPDHLQTAGDFRASVSVSCEEFRASECSSWIARSTLDEFVTALREFESARIGCATLESMSPGEFALSIASSSPAQWPTISGIVTGQYDSRLHRYRAQLTFAFALDSSFVVKLLNDFDTILGNGGNS
jgi:hypothetical protein